MYPAYELNVQWMPHFHIIRRGTLEMNQEGETVLSSRGKMKDSLAVNRWQRRVLHTQQWSEHGFSNWLSGLSRAALSYPIRHVYFYDPRH